MKKLFAILLLVVFSFYATGCYTMHHVVGEGAKGSQVEEAKTWYALWGLVPISEADSKEMAGGATDYTITTQHSFIDVVIGVFTSFVTIYPKTVKVQK
jgi:predicted small secreted protein